ncbi:MAG: peptidoglycan editing factor PgeF [Deltaproteobacteria bacterium]|nr:peptidoglycan editing factor PgeF [Deltaproteobacteria bacterium]
MGAAIHSSLPSVAALKRCSCNGIPFYRFRQLAECEAAGHAIFTRLGGVSPPPFDSLNVGYNTGDKAANVRQNLARITMVTGSSRLLFSRQVHGSNIMIVNMSPQIDPELPSPYHGYDGFICPLPNVVLLVKIADCQAVLLFDRQQRVAALLHVGWRGNVDNIAAKAVHLMVHHYHSRPQEILAAIGPSLGPCCAEFRQWRDYFPGHFREFETEENHFDLWALSRQQLLDAGLVAEHIEIAGLCTKCHTDIFFSYRGEGETGRFAAALWTCG